jgi:hypothetical protein
MSSKLRFYIAFSLLLLLTIGFNSYRLARDLPEKYQSIRPDIGQHGLWRSANFAFGKKIADYVKFVNETVPTDMPVIISTVGPPALNRAAPLQMLLYPRSIARCAINSIGCYESYLNQGYAVLLFSESAVFENAEETDYRIAMFDESWGVVLPAEAKPSDGTMTGFSSLIMIFFSGLSTFVVFVLLTIPGTLLIDKNLPALPLALKISLGFGIGTGLYTLLCFIPLLAGYVVTPILAGGGIIFLWLATMLLTRPRLNPLKKLLEIQLDPWLFVLIVPTLLGAVLAVGFGYHITDEWNIWGPKGYGLTLVPVREAARYWGGTTTAYPLNIPILIATSQALFSEQLPQSKLIFPFYHLALTLGIFGFLNTRTRRNTAALAALAIATTPVIFRHGTLAYANLPTSILLLFGSFLFMLSEREEHQTRSRTIMWGSITLALASWTRPEAVQASLIVVISFFALEFFKKRPTLKNTLAALMPVTCYLIFWQFISPIIYAGNDFNSTLFQTGIAQILNGVFRDAELVFILKAFIIDIFSLELWGLLFWILIPIGVVLLFSKRTPAHLNVLIIGGGLNILAVLTGYYLLAFIDFQNKDISWWVSTGLDRLAMPGVLMLALGIILWIIEAWGLGKPQTNEVGNS